MESNAIFTYHKLSIVCENVHDIMYRQGNSRNAQSYLKSLMMLIRQIPSNDSSIIGMEARALCYEIMGKYDQAIIARLQEIKLIERLHLSLNECDASMPIRKYALSKWDNAALLERKVIVDKLRALCQNECNPKNDAIEPDKSQG